MVRSERKRKRKQARTNQILYKLTKNQTLTIQGSLNNKSLSMDRRFKLLPGIGSFIDLIIIKIIDISMGLTKFRA